MCHTPKSYEFDKWLEDKFLPENSNPYFWLSINLNNKNQFFKYYVILWQLL